jgi:hypothetical protein
MTTIDNIDLQLNCITQAVYHESHTQSDRAKLGVVFSILNRVKSKGYGKDACEVVYQNKDGQFQFVGIQDMVELKHEPYTMEDFLKTKLLVLKAWYDPSLNPIGNKVNFHDDSLKMHHVHFIKIDHIIFY